MSHYSESFSLWNTMKNFIPNLFSLSYKVESNHNTKEKDDINERSITSNHSNLSTKESTESNHLEEMRRKFFKANSNSFTLQHKDIKLCPNFTFVQCNRQETPEQLFVKKLSCSYEVINKGRYRQNVLCQVKLIVNKRNREILLRNKAMKRNDPLIIRYEPGEIFKEETLKKPRVSQINWKKREIEESQQDKESNYALKKQMKRMSETILEYEREGKLLKDNQSQFSFKLIIQENKINALTNKNNEYKKENEKKEVICQELKKENEVYRKDLEQMIRIQSEIEIKERRRYFIQKNLSMIEENRDDEDTGERERIKIKEQKEKAEIERKRKEEQLKRKKEEIQKQKEEEERERKLLGEIENMKREEEQRRAREEQERKTKEEQQRKIREEEERKAKEEKDKIEKQLKEELEIKAKEEEERKDKEEQEKLEKQIKDEQERKAKEEKGTEERKLKEKQEKEKESLSNLNTNAVVLNIINQEEQKLINKPDSNNINQNKIQEAFIIQSDSNKNNVYDTSSLTQPNPNENITFNLFPNSQVSTNLTSVNQVQSQPINTTSTTKILALSSTESQNLHHESNPFLSHLYNKSDTQSSIPEIFKAQPIASLQNVSCNINPPQNQINTQNPFNTQLASYQTNNSYMTSNNAFNTLSSSMMNSSNSIITNPFNTQQINQQQCSNQVMNVDMYDNPNSISHNNFQSQSNTTANTPSLNLNNSQSFQLAIPNQNPFNTIQNTYQQQPSSIQLPNSFTLKQPMNNGFNSTLATSPNPFIPKSSNSTSHSLLEDNDGPKRKYNQYGRRF